MNREAPSMMGDRLVMQESLFYQFRLDDHVPADHMLRAIDRFLDLDGFAVDASLIAADANKQRSVSSAEHTDWRSLATSRRAVREYLDTLDQAAWGAASVTVPKFVSPSDPAAQWTGAHKGHAFFAYADNYLIDLKAAVIVD